MMTADPAKNPKGVLLFLSALDFKEKSIQVIRKTPEAYSKAGWSVHYIVTSDPPSVYSYERTTNPIGVRVTRITKERRNTPRSRALQFLVWKVRRFADIYSLARRARDIAKQIQPDIIYGYEVHGVLAAMLLKYMYRIKEPRYISRFQGTHLYSYLKNRQFAKLLLHLEHIIAMLLPSHLCIMTDDGTKGDTFLQMIRSPNTKNLYFWMNGVDPQKNTHVTKQSLRESRGISNDKTILLSVSRLVSWKRVDRGILILERLVKEQQYTNVEYWIVGDGPERAKLESLAKHRDILDHVKFFGAIPHDDVWQYYRMADIFISMYDSSNVGNPLLEAIREHLIITTLDNGDTGKWIRHNENGFLYPVTAEFYSQAAQDIAHLGRHHHLRDHLKAGIRMTESRLWTWEQRLASELSATEGLLCKP